jgi:hypothetical protein
VDTGTPWLAPPNNMAIILLNKVWENKILLPRINAFAWRRIRREIPTGEKASRYSKHISNICCRCGTQENDIHLFSLALLQGLLGSTLPSTLEWMLLLKMLTTYTLSSQTG